jgi:hypothetical protein
MQLASTNRSIVTPQSFCLYLLDGKSFDELKPDIKNLRITTKNNKNKNYFHLKKNLILSNLK